MGEKYASRSEAVRALVDKGLEYDDLEAENEHLRRQLAAANQRIDASNELVEYVEEERSITQRRAQASVFTRAKWWLTGMPADKDDNDNNSNG